MTNTKKWLCAALVLIMVSMFGATLFAGCEGCASLQRSCKTCESEMTGGLDRTVNVYSYDGKLLASYSGKIDVEENETKVLFDLDGKRYIYYNAIVEVIEN
ncbi:MAG: hypothetical protein J6L81_04510 [Clostridia bacterium]|nr:hypothetical protein [Clostridia bacterium]